MKIKKFRNLVFNILNSTDQLDIESALPDFNNSQVIYIELHDGSKFQIVILTTDKII